MTNAIFSILVVAIVFFGSWIWLRDSRVTMENQPTKENQQSAMNQNNQSQEKNMELQIEVIKEGTGDRVTKKGDTVEMHYTGTLLDGTKFDSSRDRGETFSFTLGAGQVIAGWDEGLLGMKVGEQRKLTIPADMAYGSRATGPIPANSTLIFDTELVAIQEAL